MATKAAAQHLGQQLMVAVSLAPGSPLIWNLSKKFATYSSIDHKNSAFNPLDVAELQHQHNTPRYVSTDVDINQDDFIAQAIVMLGLYRLQNGWSLKTTCAQLSLYGGKNPSCQSILENVWQAEIDLLKKENKVGKIFNHQDNYEQFMRLYTHQRGSTKASSWDRRYSSSSRNYVHVYSEQAVVQWAKSVSQQDKRLAQLAGWLLRFQLKNNTCKELEERLITVSKQGGDFSENLRDGLVAYCRSRSRELPLYFLAQAQNMADIQPGMPALTNAVPDMKQEPEVTLDVFAPQPDTPRSPLATQLVDPHQDPTNPASDIKQDPEVTLEITATPQNPLKTLRADPHQIPTNMAPEEKFETLTGAQKWEVMAAQEVAQDNMKDIAAAINASYFLRRQSDSSDSHATIPGVLGGQSQIPECEVASATVLSRQQPLVEAGILSCIERVYLAINKQLHPTCPGHQIGVTRAFTGTVNLTGLLRKLQKLNLGEDHAFPLFVGTGTTGEWWYVGHYKVVKDLPGQVVDEVEHVIPTDPAYRYKNMNAGHAEAAQHWVIALADENKSWSGSLNVFQANIEEKIKLEPLDPDAPLHKAYVSLKKKKMLNPKSGTKNQREEVTRELLESGAMSIDYCWLQYVRFDDKLYKCLQERATGQHATVRQIWKSNKRSGGALAGGSSKRSRRGQAEKSAAVNINWPLTDGAFARYPGVLYEYTEDKATKYIVFDGEKKKYYIEELNRDKNQVKFTKTVVPSQMQEKYYEIEINVL